MESRWPSGGASLPSAQRQVTDFRGLPLRQCAAMCGKVQCPERPCPGTPEPMRLHDALLESLLRAHLEAVDAVDAALSVSADDRNRSRAFPRPLPTRFQPPPELPPTPARVTMAQPHYPQVVPEPSCGSGPESTTPRGPTGLQVAEGMRHSALRADGARPAAFLPPRLPFKSAPPCLDGARHGQVV